MLARKYEADYAEEQITSRQAPQSRRKRLLKQGVRVDSKLRSRIIKLVTLVAVGAGIITAMSGTNSSRGYALVQMQNETRQLEMENRQLQLEISQMKSPQRIKDIATKDLGMVVPDEVYFASEK